MNKLRLSALVLAGALSLSLLTACGGESADPPSVSSTPPAATEPAAGGESPVPGGSTVPETPETESPSPEESQPAETPEADHTPEPEADPEPEATPVPEVTPAPEPIPEPTPAPEESAPETGAPEEDAPIGDPTVIQAIWQSISQLDLPAFMELDPETLSAVYGIDSADLEEYVCAMPMMNVHATEFFLARVKEDNLDAVTAALEQRQSDLEAQWAQYLPDQLELVQSYKLVVNGNFVLFAVSEHADQAAEIFATYTN